MTSLTISGIISGLDTSSIIDKLVAVEGNSKTLLTNQQAARKSAVTAYSTMLSSIGALATQVGALAKTSTWATTTAVSSSTSVSATATGNQPGSLTFNVTAVAAAHTLISSGTVTSTGATVASSGSIALTKNDGTVSNISVGSGSLAEVVSGINAANLGITAAAVQTSPGQYRLQIGATSTGASSQFSLTGVDGFAAMNTLTGGADATIRIGGAGVNAYDVSSSTNKFSNITSGLSFTVSKLETGVTVSSSMDPASVSDQIASIVTNANNLLSSIAANTTWDATSKSGGPLLGDSTVRSLQQGILSIVASVAAPGLSVTSAGQLSFDKAAFATAFTASPTAVASAFGASSTFVSAPGTTATATYSNATSSTAAGVYAVNVTSAAKTEQWQVIPPGTGVVGRLISLQRGSTTINYTMDAADDPAAAAAKLNAKLAQAGFGVSASASTDGLGIVLTANGAGTGSAFTVTSSGAASQTTAGANIAGTIGGVAATGIGNILTVPPSTTAGGPSGLSIAVSASAADIASSGGAIGSISYKPGLAQKLDRLFGQMSDSSTGQLVTAQAQASKQVSDLQDAIDSWTTKLEAYRKNLTFKFTAMESALASLKAQSTALNSFSGVSSSSSSSSSS